MSSSRLPGSAPVDARVARSRDRVLVASRALLLEEGPTAFTIDAVIQRSGVARMTVYRHWSSRDELLLAAFRALVPEPGPPAAETSADPVAALTSAVVAYGREFAMAEWAQAMPGLLDYARQHPEVASIWGEFAEARGKHLATLLATCISAGAVAHLDVDQAISQLMGPIAFRRFLSFEPITDDFCEALVRDLIAAHTP